MASIPLQTHESIVQKTLLNLWLQQKVNQAPLNCQVRVVKTLQAQCPLKNILYQ